jgi:putative membrane protein
MVNRPDAAALERLKAAIAAAEAETTGEIRCVIRVRPQRHVEWITALAALAGLCLPWAAAMAGWGPGHWLPGRDGPTPLSERLIVDLYTSAQLLLFALFWAIGWLTPIGGRWAPAAIRRARLHRHALDQFLLLGMQRTAGRSAVLIIVDVTDHVAEVLADRGIYAKVPPAHWGDTLAAVLDGVRNGRLVAGLEQGIALAGAVLARHFPAAPGHPNELADRVILD